jgi:hypothetical protein
MWCEHTRLFCRGGRYVLDIFQLTREIGQHAWLDALFFHELDEEIGPSIGMLNGVASAQDDAGNAQFQAVRSR